MYSNRSIRTLLKTNAIFMLCLCMLTMLAATSAPAYADEQDGGSVEELQNEETGDTQTTDEAALPVDTLLSEAQAVVLVCEQLRADDTWQVIAEELVKNGRDTYYQIIAIDPVGDARCRLVNTLTGEITVRSLWKTEGAQNEADQPSEKTDESDNASTSDEGQQEADRQAGENDRETENRRDNVQQGEENQNGQDGAEAPLPADAPASARLADDLMQTLNAEAKCLLTLLTRKI